MAPMVVWLMLVTHCVVSVTYAQSPMSQDCQPMTCPQGSSWDSVMCGCVIPGISNTPAANDPLNTAPTQTAQSTPPLPPTNTRPYFGFDPTYLALSGENDLLANAFLFGGGKLSNAPLPSTIPVTPGPASQSQSPFGTPFSNVSPYLLGGNGDLVETLALQNMIGGRRGGRMDLAYALGHGSDAMRNAMMMNSLYPNNGIGRNMMLLRGSDAAKDLYILNALNKGKAGSQTSYMNTLGATGALGENYRDMMATRAVLQETNPVRQIMLSDMLDVPDATQRWITLKAYQGQRQTGSPMSTMLY